ncbi:MAG: response regulator [Alphaproteobacteria bacterium]
MASILIIDDEELVRTTLRIILERAGHDVLEASDGLEGLGVLSQCPADVVFTDIIMPNMEGIETIRVLRTSHPAVKIIAISGGGRRNTVDYLDIAGRLGAHRALPKPFHQSEVLEAVHNVLLDAPQSQA